MGFAPSLSRTTHLPLSQLVLLVQHKHALVHSHQPHSGPTVTLYLEAHLLPRQRLPVVLPTAFDHQLQGGGEAGRSSEPCEGHRGRGSPGWTQRRKRGRGRVPEMLTVPTHESLTSTHTESATTSLLPLAPISV